MSASHAQPTTTANQIPRTPIGGAAAPKSPNTMAKPPRSERSASDDAPRRRITHAAKKQLIARETNARAPAMKWISPVVLIELGGPLGVPGGNPSTGSAGN